MTLIIVVDPFASLVSNIKLAVRWSLVETLLPAGFSCTLKSEEVRLDRKIHFIMEESENDNTSKCKNLRMRIQASVLTQEFYPICTQEKRPTEANAAFQLGSMFHLKETKQLYFITIKISVSISQNAKAVICLLSQGSSLLRRCLRPEEQLAAHTLPKVS